MQAEKQTGESHHEHDGAEEAKLVNAVRELSFYPLDENSHPHALQDQCERYENDRYKTLVGENHRWSVCLYRTARSGAAYPATALTSSDWVNGGVVGRLLQAARCWKVERIAVEEKSIIRPR